MKIIFVFIFSVFLIIAGCTSNTAYKHNQAIVQIEKELGPYIDEATRKFNVFYESKNYDSVVVVSQQMEEVIEKKLDEIKKMDMSGVNGGDEFKSAAVKYFSYMKSTYSAYRIFGMEPNEEEREVKRQRLIDVLDENRIAIKTLNDAQRKFAKANNFRMKE